MEGSPPAMWGHCSRVYEAMVAQASEQDHQDRKVMVYEGYTSKLFAELGIAVPNYGLVLHTLEDMGCISQARRGGGPLASQWILWKEPELDVFMEAHKKGTVGARQDKFAQLEQQIADLRESLGGFDIPKALITIQRDIDKLKEHATHGN